MKFKNYLENITGVEIYPLISLMVFFVFFVVLFWYVFRTDKKHFEHMSQVPLADDNDME